MMSFTMTTSLPEGWQLLDYRTGVKSDWVSDGGRDLEGRESDNQRKGRNKDRKMEKDKYKSWGKTGPSVDVSLKPNTALPADLVRNRHPYNHMLLRDANQNRQAHISLSLYSPSVCYHNRKGHPSSTLRLTKKKTKNASSAGASWIRTGPNVFTHVLHFCCSLPVLETHCITGEGRGRTEGGVLLWNKGAEGWRVKNCCSETSLVKDSESSGALPFTSHMDVWMDDRLLILHPAVATSCQANRTSAGWQVTCPVQYQFTLSRPSKRSCLSLKPAPPLRGRHHDF